MTQGIAGSWQNKCLLWRVLKLDSRYRQIKYKKLTKKQLKVKYTTLNKKLKNIEDQDDESTSSSSKDREETHAKRKLPRQNEGKSSKRAKIHTTSSKNKVMERSHPEETPNEKKKMILQITPKANVLFKNTLNVTRVTYQAIRFTTDS